MKKCLVVDDVEVTRYTARVFLEELGFEVSDAFDENSALEALKENIPDVIILDWHLKKFSGLELMADIREKFSETVKIIMISGVEGEEKASEALSAGADAFIRKPTTKEKLETEILRLGV